MYQASTVLDIVRQSSNPVGLAGSVPVFGSEDFLPSQVELLQSRDVAERVVRQLNLLSDPEFLAVYLVSSPIPRRPPRPARQRRRGNLRPRRSPAPPVRSERSADASIVK